MRSVHRRFYADFQFVSDKKFDMAAGFRLAGLEWKMRLPGLANPVWEGWIKKGGVGLETKALIRWFDPGHWIWWNIEMQPELRQS